MVQKFPTIINRGSYVSIVAQPAAASVRQRLTVNTYYIATVCHESEDQNCFRSVVFWWRGILFKASIQLAQQLYRCWQPQVTLNLYSSQLM